MTGTTRASQVDRDDLAASFYRLARVFGAAEVPILATYGVSMWEYIILCALEKEPAGSQSELAQRTGRDKTRLIGNLDALEAAGLIRKARVVDDRRHTSVQLTAVGREVVGRCRTGIRSMENESLSVFTVKEREVFLEVLKRLHP